MTDLNRERSSTIPELAVVAGSTAAEVLERLRGMLADERLRGTLPGALKSMAYEGQRAFNGGGAPGPCRAAVTASGEAELAKKLAFLQKLITEKPDEGFAYPAAGLFYGTTGPGGKLAYLFPGQGSQYIGMGAELAATYPTAQAVWDRLGAIRFADTSIQEVVSPPPPKNEEEEFLQLIRLVGADWTNTCISVAGQAILALLTRLGVRADAVAAHSWGDIASYHAAGVISERDMIELTRYRGELGVACPTATQGCILAAQASGRQIKELLDRHEIREAWIANYNTPTQTVLSGMKADIHRTKEVLDAAEIKAKLIPISAAPHCPLAVPVATTFGKRLDEIEFRQAECDVYSYLFGRKVENDPERLRHTLWVQTEKPVRFIRQIEKMHEDGVRTFVEVAPSNVLTRCVEEILAGKPHAAVAMDKRKEDSNLAFLLGVARLVADGRVRDLSVLWEGYAAPDRAGSAPGAAPADLDEKSLKLLDLEFAKISNERASAA